MALNVEFGTYEELITFLNRERSLFFLVSYNVIKQCIDDNDDLALIANLTVGDSVFTIQIERKDFNRHLIKSLSYFEYDENYEMCRKVKDLMDLV